MHYLSHIWVHTIIGSICYERDDTYAGCIRYLHVIHDLLKNHMHEITLCFVPKFFTYLKFFLHFFFSLSLYPFFIIKKFH